MDRAQGVNLKIIELVTVCRAAMVRVVSGITPLAVMDPNAGPATAQGVSLKITELVTVCRAATVSVALGTTLNAVMDLSAGTVMGHCSLSKSL